MKRKVTLMVLTILILQVLLPVLTIIWETGFTIKSIAILGNVTSKDGLWNYREAVSRTVSI